jgi:hypothetical protein
MTEILFLHNYINSLIARGDNRGDYYLSDSDPVYPASDFASLLAASLHGTLFCFAMDKIIIGLDDKMIFIKYYGDSVDGYWFDTVFSVSIYPL